MRPRVNKARRLVLVHSTVLGGSYHLYKIDRDNTMSRHFKELVSFADRPQDACRSMDQPFSGFVAVNGVVANKYNTVAEQVEAIWAAAIS